MVSGTSGTDEESGDYLGESPAPITVPWRSPTLHVIIANSLMAAAGASLISPALPAIRDALTLSDLQAGLILAIFSLPSIVLAPVAGVLADRFGRRVVLIPSLVGFGLSGGGVVLTADFTIILVLRFFQGGFASGLIMLSLTLVGDCFRGPRRNAVMGINTAATTIGVAVFPILGGFLAEIQWYLPFAIYGISGVVGLFAYLTLVEPDIESGTLDMSYLRGAAEQVLTRDGLLLYAVVLTMFLLFFGVVATAIPFLLSEAFSLRSSSIGVVLSVPLVTSSIVAFGNGRLIRYISNRQLIGLGFIGYGLGIAAVWVATSPVHVATTLVFLGIGHGFIIPSVDSAISTLAPDALRGGVMSLRISVKKVGQTAGPYIFATTGALVGYPSLLAIVGVTTLVGGCIICVILHGHRPEERAV